MSDHTMFLDFGLFSINWYGLMMGVTVLLTAGLYVLLRRRQGENAENSLTTALIAMPAALVGARVFYCWFAKALFAGGVIEMMNLLTGGYALYGALLGILPVISARGLRGGKSLPAMLDAVCPPLSFAIAAEKWAGLINGSDIGFSVSAPWVQRFPFSLLSAADQTYYLFVRPTKVAPFSRSTFKELNFSHTSLLPLAKFSSTSLMFWSEPPKIKTHFPQKFVMSPKLAFCAGICHIFATENFKPYQNENEETIFQENDGSGGFRSLVAAAHGLPAQQNHIR